MRIMSVDKMKITLFALLCISVSSESTVIKHFEREWNLTLNDLTIQDESIGKNNIFPYAKCSLATGNERNCTVVLEAFHPDGVVYKNKCFTRFHTEKGSEGVNMLQMRAVKNGKIVFSYADIQDMSKKDATANLKFRVLDTLTCKSHEAKVFVNVTLSDEEYSKVQSDSFWLTSVFAYKDGSIDAFLPFRNLCDGARCKVSFDANGQSIVKPVSYLSRDLYYYDDVKLYADTYYRNQKTKDLFIVVNGYKASSHRHSVKDNERVELTLIYVKANGITKQLLHLQDKKPIIADVDIDNHGALSICWSKRDDSNITAVNCRHYDHNNTDLDEESFEFELPYPIKTLKIRRTFHSEAPIPALLVLTDECQTEICESDGHYYVRLISLKTNNADDFQDQFTPHNSHNMEVSGLSCPEKNKDISLSPAWNHDGLNVCVSLTCERSGYHKEFYKSYRLVRQCFSMKYLDRSFD